MKILSACVVGTKQIYKLGCRCYCIFTAIH